MRDPAELAAAYIAIPSPTGAEEELRARVASDLAAGGLVVHHVAGCVVAESHPGVEGATALVAHLDTVPGELAVKVTPTELAGRGAVDSKGGLAVAVALATSEPRVPVVLVAYPGEEGPLVTNGLAALRAQRPELLRAGRGVLLEPTGGFVELGCQGVLKLRLRLAGRRSHVARAWIGRNAITRLARVLGAIERLERREPQLEGVRYREAVEPVGVRGGLAWNVVPDEAILEVAYRFAPDRSPEEASAALRAVLDDVLEPDDVVEVVEAVPGARSDVHAFEGLVRSAFGVRAKLGWTDVAQLAAAGIPAVNFGPGDPELAHTDAEVVEVAELRFVAQTLWRWLHEGPARQG